MNQNLEHQILLSRFIAFQAILHDRGINLPLPTAEDADKMNNSDLGDLVRQVRDVARTPTQG